MNQIVRAVEMGAEKIIVIATKKPLDRRLTENSTISNSGFFIAAKAPNTKPITKPIRFVVATTTHESPIVAHKPLPIQEALLKDPLPFPSGGAAKFLVKYATSLNVRSFNFDHIAVIL